MTKIVSLRLAGLSSIVLSVVAFASHAAAHDNPLTRFSTRQPSNFHHQTDKPEIVMPVSRIVLSRIAQVGFRTCTSKKVIS